MEVRSEGLPQQRGAAGARRAGEGEGAMAKGAGLDGKTALQELVATLGRGNLEYQITESGPDHDKNFVAVATVGGQSIAEGAGKSKREAEQSAARTAYEVLTTLK